MSVVGVLVSGEVGWVRGDDRATKIYKVLYFTVLLPIMKAYFYFNVYFVGTYIVHMYCVCDASIRRVI